MLPHVRAVVLVAVVALLLPTNLGLSQENTGPTAADDKARPTTTVTFYPHVFAATAGGPMPGNTQFPAGEEDFSAGYPDNGCYPDSLAPLEALPTIPLGTVPFMGDVYFPNCDTWTNNLLFVYSTAGFVHANADFFDYADIHNERGQAKDVILDPTQDITATFYMSSDWHPWFCLDGTPVSGVPSPYPCWNWDPGFFPKWQIQARFLLGSMGEYQGQASDPPPVWEKVSSGDVVEVAKGVSEPQDMLSLDASLNGKGEVYEYTINLGKPTVDRIPKEMDWIMEFRWWIRLDDATKVIPGQRFNWNINSGEFYPNRFTLPIKNPFDVELVYPQFLHDKLLIHAMLNSPWGSYDVDSKSVAIDIRGDTAGPVQMQTFSRSADFSVAHGGHYKPVNLTWVWDYKADKLAPGDYTVTVTASNFQHSASSTTQGKFRILPDGTGQVLVIGRTGQQTSTSGQLEQAGLTTQAASFALVEPSLGAAALLALVLPGLALAARRRSK
ncbi:MAG TPA: hypothetical protein VGR28_05145 [Candidatus Thermoplasmatota archaeon]|nr:hypothetical protein [Candidatus Thermoplasmatota archaeon]